MIDKYEIWIERKKTAEGGGAWWWRSRSKWKMKGWPLIMTMVVVRVGDQKAVVVEINGGGEDSGGYG